MAEQPEENTDSRRPGNSDDEPGSSSWPYETVLAFSGNYVTRLKSTLFYWGALLSFGGGI